MNVHSNARPYTCGFPNCPKTFSVRSNARRHYRTHGDKLLRLGSPVPTQPGIKFVELIHVPEPPLPPLSLSQAPFRVRWVPANERALTKTVHPTKRPERKLNLLEKPDGSHEQQMRPPMFLYDPSSNPGPSTHGVRDSSGPWRTYP
ncbi:hypothetical protein B0H19DRAFT_1261528 [Mycena capillaripes]|nr:hypothetical protein B0H19DRAFT_1261528 [Mycena capillaripes]